MPPLDLRGKGMLRSLKQAVWRLLPELAFYIEYYRGAKKMGDLARERTELFEGLLKESRGKKCLQIGVKEEYGAKFGDNWASVDLYDTRDFIDFHYDVHDLKFGAEEFDVAVCISILEHIENPQKAIGELHRVLKPGGLIWVQLPFHYPYHESPKDYWRASPDGLRVWMSDFHEIACGSFLWSRSPLATSTFFYGARPVRPTLSTESGERWDSGGAQ